MKEGVCSLSLSNYTKTNFEDDYRSTHMLESKAVNGVLSPFYLIFFKALICTLQAVTGQIASHYFWLP